MTNARHLLAAVAALLLAMAPARAGSVKTLAGTMEGKIAFHKDHVAVDDKKAAWGEVLSLLLTTPDHLLSRSQWVHLNNGESWAAELVSLADGKFKLRSDLFGVKQVEADRVSGIDFAWQRGIRKKDRKPETLYRDKGEPIPGKLLAIKADKVVVSSVVGDLELRRDGLLAYDFTDEQPAWKASEDEVTLIDGSIFRGKLSADAEGLQLEHAILGRLALPARIVHSVVRHPEGTLDLTELSPESVESAGVLPSAKKGPAQFRTMRELEAKTGRFVKGLSIEPKTVIRYKLPDSKEKTGRLSALLMSSPGAQGEARLQIRQGKKVLVDKALPAAAKPETLTIDVAAGAELEISVDFGERVRFPCGVILGDPIVIWEKR